MNSKTLATCLKFLNELNIFSEYELKRLGKIGITTYLDLLMHFPVKYQDLTKVTAIKNIYNNQFALIEGIVHQHNNYPEKKTIQFKIKDKTGSIDIIFFNKKHWALKLIKNNIPLRIAGEVQVNGNQRQITHPLCFFKFSNDKWPRCESRLTPIYTIHKGIKPSNISKAISSILNILSNKEYPETKDYHIKIPYYDTLSIYEALIRIHKPYPGDNISELLSKTHIAYKALAFSEFIGFKHTLESIELTAMPAACINKKSKFQKLLRNNLGFDLTPDQIVAIDKIRYKLEQKNIMQILLQGEVGCGKTIVAAHPALWLAEHNLQTAIMAPTELLARQIYKNFKNWLQEFDIETACLTGSSKASERKKILSRVLDGKIKILIGTHALFQDNVLFNNLKLVIIDEQHRFGVTQRYKLCQKALNLPLCHLLVMTATPIPRTLAQIMFAKFELICIEQKPSLQKPITTLVMPELKRNDVIEFVKKIADRGEQVYWVCPLVEDSEELELLSVNSLNKMLATELKDYKTATLHGKLPAKNKEDIFSDFLHNNIQILLATTVIEVGVDNPNATLIIIEHAERFGLAQLHQLRGRVGRGFKSSHCILLYNYKLSNNSKARLQAMRRGDNGFQLAKLDLKIRGFGEIIGNRQTGHQGLFLANNFLEDMNQIYQECTKKSSISVSAATIFSRIWFSSKKELQFS